MSSVEVFKLNISLEDIGSIWCKLFLNDDRVVNSADNLHLVARKTMLALLLGRATPLRRQKLAQACPCIPLSLTQNWPEPHARHEGMNKAGMVIDLPIDGRGNSNMRVCSGKYLSTSSACRGKFFGECGPGINLLITLGLRGNQWARTEPTADKETQNLLRYQSTGVQKT